MAPFRSFTFEELAGSGFPLLEYAPDATIMTDKDGRICLVNAQAERLFGYYREEMIGQPIEMLIPPRYRAKHVGERGGYFHDPHVRPMGVGLELHGLRKNGTEFPVEISLSPVTTREGTFISSAIRDSTERKNFERQLRQLNAQLEDASRAKDRFLASMSHELRTPLNAVIGFTGTLLMELPGPLNAEQKRQLEIVQSSAHHLLSLINDILDLAKIESGKVDLRYESVQLESVIADVAAALAESAAKKGLAFTVHGPETSVVTDRRALQQVLLNLTNNAIKYTDEGAVRIDVAPARLREQPAVAVAVSDTGIGIRAEDQARLFMAFEQIDRDKREHEGTGLGLYLCRNLTNMLGGELSVQSEFKRGSTFTLTLPLDQ